LAGDLSQSEIDALLAAISSGQDIGAKAPGVDTGGVSVAERTRKSKIRIYDFKRPEKFSKEQTSTIHNIHETFARHITTYLSAQLRAYVNVSVVSVDQITYEEFIRSINNPTVICIFDMETLEGNSILEIQLPVVFAIIDRLFGGQGGKIDTIRPLTEIEETVIKKVLSRILLNLREAWKQIHEIRPKLKILESNPQFAQIIGPNEMVLLITFEIKVGDVEGIMNLCIPYIILDPIASKLSASVWYATVQREVSNTEVEAISDKLKRSEVELVVELGETEVTLQELLNLKVGDYIMLKKKIDEPLVVKVHERIKFLCRPGTLGNKMAISITHVLSEEEALDYE